MRVVAVVATLEDACVRLVEDGLAHAISSFVAARTYGEGALSVFSPNWRRSHEFWQLVQAVRECGSEFGRAVVRGDVADCSTEEDHEEPFAMQWVIQRQEDRRFVVVAFDESRKSVPAERRRREEARA